ncbi:hypothetical protein XA68_11907 [Ophiocordyceps unilateralis]|uniref:DNA mismatch repair proteins mutS family domain-containing protein n=1 Tax=Ophiocordyceps unilateralis TaxID=268505 RepID=A0A2A9PG19_OPHUN|nr:hypothetical protein XA68_11907 [Ophiocordyceps unilateralis]
MFRPRRLNGLHRLLRPRRGQPALQLAVAVPPARGKRTTTKVKLSELPQGPIHIDSKPALPLEMAQDENRGPPYPPVLLQAWRNMRKFDNCVLLTRVGGFYELYFEHADECAPLLNLKLAIKKTNAGPVSMAGFPFFQLDRFLKILVQDLNRYVAIAEEFPNDAADRIKSGGLMNDRKVCRIITPGTLIDENFIDPYTNNYTLAIHVCQDAIATEQTADAELQDCGIPALPVVGSVPLGLAWLDLSTGHFFTQFTHLQSLSAVLSRIGPREVVLDQDFQKHEDHDILTILAEDRHFITYSPQGALADVNEWTCLLEEEVPESTRSSFTEQEILAGGLLLNYVKDRLQGLSVKIQPPQRRESMQVMSIDKNSFRALEIKQTMRDGVFRGSLLHAIRRTVTKSGTRLLNDWLSAPSTCLDVINQRLNLVAYFIAGPDLCDSIIQLLRRSHDAQRLVQKFALGRGDADDLLALASTIRAADDIVSLLVPADSQSKSDSPEPGSDSDCLGPLVSRIDLEEPLKLAQRIKDAIDEESIVYQHELDESEANELLNLAQDIVASEGSQEDASLLPKTRKKRPSTLREYYGEDNEPWVMKPAASSVLQRLHSALDRLEGEKSELEKSVRERLGASSLSLKWNPGLGHFAHIRGKDIRNVVDVKALSASRTTRSFHLPEWTALGQRLDQARFRIRREEQRVFQSLRQHVIFNLVKLRRNSVVLDELDIVTSFAKLAVEHDLVRPQLNNSNSHTIIGGRHPTVEGGLVTHGRTFVRNDCLVGPPAGGLLWLITGPNMAGKSTFLRQNALITILAQIGCYVPASYAELGIVDAIFSRVGSADNLYRDQSTFMVEMQETAQILRQATPQSFVIMDEIGRGTTPEDGTAVSYACLHHLVTVNRCRTLFATHFHAVVDLAASEGLCDPSRGVVQTYCTDVQEDGQGGFVYVHKLRKGVNRRSHALKVARLAGMPESAINAAHRVLAVRSAVGPYGEVDSNEVAGVGS